MIWRFMRNIFNAFLGMFGFAQSSNKGLIPSKKDMRKPKRYKQKVQQKLNDLKIDYSIEGMQKRTEKRLKFRERQLKEFYKLTLFEDYKWKEVYALNISNARRKTNSILVCSIS